MPHSGNVEVLAVQKWKDDREEKMGDGNTRNVTKLEGSFCCTVEKSFGFCKYDMYCTHLRDDHRVVMMTTNEEL